MLDDESGRPFGELHTIDRVIMAAMRSTIAAAVLAAIAVLSMLSDVPRDVDARHRNIMESATTGVIPALHGASTVG